MDRHEPSCRMHERNEWEPTIPSFLYKAETRSLIYMGQVYNQF
jgi:hypothetical protein